MLSSASSESEQPTMSYEHESTLPFIWKEGTAVGRASGGGGANLE